jgi:hypothetical protein
MVATAIEVWRAGAVVTATAPAAGCFPVGAAQKLYLQETVEPIRFSTELIVHN